MTEQKSRTEKSPPRRAFLQRLLEIGTGAALLTEIECSAEAQAPLPPDAKSPLSTNAVTGECTQGKPLIKPRVQARVHINQVGYSPTDPKRAVISANRSLTNLSFAIVDDDVTPETRFKGKLLLYEDSSSSKSTGSSLIHYHADFDSFDREGRYRLRLGDGRQSEPFSIGRNVYTRLVPLMLQYFETQSCGEYTPAAHGPCHLDDGIALGGPRDGQKIDATGGWHDAGDYLKFVETTSYVTALMLTSFLRYSEAFPHRKKGGQLPELLAHAKVGLDWLHKMHPTPDEFYYQVGDASDHELWRLPEDDNPNKNSKWKPRPVLFGVGANLAGRTAASFALSALLYKPYDRAFAAKCLKSAETVYALGLKNKGVLTTKPADFYPETSWADDMEWAAVRLFEATGKQDYLTQAIEFSLLAGASGREASVYNSHALAHFALYPHVAKKDKARLLEYLKEDAEAVRRHSSNPYTLGTPYIWGTAEAAAGAAMVCRGYGLLTKNEEYLTLAKRQRDFVLGCNPFGICCLIGSGTRYALNPHHQIANLKAIELTGAIIGGPANYALYKGNAIELDSLEYGVPMQTLPTDPQELRALSVYQDSVGDYIANEPANDYTAKFLLVAAYDIATTYAAKPDS